MPGIPKKVDNRKNVGHPKVSTKKPAGDDNIVLATPIIEDKSAYWDAEYCRLHSTDKYATKAAEPKPPEIFSPAIVTKRK